MAGIGAVKRIGIHRIDRALPIFNSTTTQIFTRTATRENWFLNVKRWENSAMAHGRRKNKFTFFLEKKIFYAFVVTLNKIILYYNSITRKKGVLLTKLLYYLLFKKYM